VCGRGDEPGDEASIAGPLHFLFAFYAYVFSVFSAHYFTRLLHHLHAVLATIDYVVRIPPDPLASQAYIHADIHIRHPCNPLSENPGYEPGMA